MSGDFLLIYICNFYVLSHLLLIYICKLHLKTEALSTEQIRVTNDVFSDSDDEPTSRSFFPFKAYKGRPLRTLVSTEGVEGVASETAAETRDVPSGAGSSFEHALRDEYGGGSFPDLLQVSDTEEEEAVESGKDGEGDLEVSVQYPSVFSWLGLEIAPPPAPESAAAGTRDEPPSICTVRAQLEQERALRDFEEHQLSDLPTVYTPCISEDSREIDRLQQQLLVVKAHKEALAREHTLAVEETRRQQFELEAKKAEVEKLKKLLRRDTRQTRVAI